ncbi:starch synthase [candidate division WOR-1 bacterium RIFOXYA2_FULL_37_7]|nr:MAG: starch synthase [candidate division WOR-1 bacterium RIFOXYA2_FULL_37_7]
MKILYVSAEVVPFAKTGGLADVAGALPKAIEKLGHDIKIIMPKYGVIDEEKYKLTKLYAKIAVPVGDKIETASIYEAKLPNSKIVVYFVDNKKYFSRRGLYQEDGVDYPDNCERFSFFCRAVCELIKELKWIPDVLHCNDWQTALVIPYFKFKYDFNKTVTVYSIHNMGYLGLFPKDQIFLTGFGWKMFTYDKLEFWDQLSLAKAGLVFADIITTVSPTYAKEIQTKQSGFGLHELLLSRSDRVFGILNGIDYDIWNPATDPSIAKNFTINTIENKYLNKSALQKKNGLQIKKTVPLIGLISRLTDQKGLDILTKALEEIMKLNCQLVILGTGDKKYHKLLDEAWKKHPKQIGLNLGFDAALAELIYAGSDMFIMPSRYEPCGLGQLISFKYGTVPIVRKTGGLADTVNDYNSKMQKGDGFVFEEYTNEALFDAVKRAVLTYNKKKEWAYLMKKIMLSDYSWDVSAKKYLEIYAKRESLK